MTIELAHENDLVVDTVGYKEEYEKHQELSRVGAEKKFKGGLADHGTRTTRMHTATHLLNEALRKILDPKIVQKGSNITAERLRFDFNFDRKLTPEEVKRVEDEVNRIVKLGLDVSKSDMNVEEAKEKGAQSEFGVRYPPKVSVYKVGDYSLEICMGPHVKNTKEVGVFKIIKEESVAAGIRRIKAVVED
jgi:alanyl-tRNA synthetase